MGTGDTPQCSSSGRSSNSSGHDISKPCTSPFQAHVAANPLVSTVLSSGMHQFFAQLGGVIVHRLSNPLSSPLSSSPASSADGLHADHHSHHDRIPRWLKRLEQRFHIHGFHLHRREAVQTHRVASQLVDKGRLHERRLEMAEAAQCFEQAVALEPSNVEYLGLLSKQLSDRSYEEGVSRAQVKEFNRRAIEVADKAITAGPGLPDGHLARCAAPLRRSCSPRAGRVLPAG
jgi:tetratricopeptide (TPR) repeat protein